MRRSSLNFVVDLFAFLDLLALVFTGFVIKYILPPGTGGLGKRLHERTGREHIKNLWSMSRHQWGEIHFWICVAVLIVTIVHVIIDWKALRGVIRYLTSVHRDTITRT